MKHLEHMKSYLISWMDEDNDYLDASLDSDRSNADRFTYYADMCGVSPFVLRNWLLGRGKPNWQRIEDELDKLGVCYIPAGEL